MWLIKLKLIAYSEIADLINFYPQRQQPIVKGAVKRDRFTGAGDAQAPLFV